MKNEGLVITIYGKPFTGKTTYIRKLIKAWKIKNPVVFQAAETRRVLRQIEKITLYTSYDDLLAKIDGCIKEGHKFFFFDEAHFLPKEFFGHIYDIQMRGISLIFVTLTLFDELKEKSTIIHHAKPQCVRCKKFVKKDKLDIIVSNIEIYEILCEKCYIENYYKMLEVELCNTKNNVL